MLTSKERAALRAQANELETTLMVGKDGVSDGVIAQAVVELDARELVKGRVLESAMMSAREASDQICQATGADGVSTVGSKFVIYRKSRKKDAQAKQRTEKKALANPVRKGAQARRRQAHAERERRNAYFKQAAIDAAIARRKADQS